MGDYPITEMLTRTIALERLKELSRLYLSAAYDMDAPTMRMIDEERKYIRDQYLKTVVK